MGRKPGKESLDAFTERAIRATDAGALIPPIVYLPSRLRGHNQRLTVDHVRITTDAPTVEENHIRIREADPLGFLIALMHGQPIPTFTITPEGSIKIVYEVADLARRETIAKWLAHKVTIRIHDLPRPGGQRTAPEGQSWDEIVARRNQQDRTE